MSPGARFALTVTAAALAAGLTLAMARLLPPAAFAGLAAPALGAALLIRVLRR